MAPQQGGPAAPPRSRCNPRRERRSDICRRDCGAKFSLGGGVNALFDGESGSSRTRWNNLAGTRDDQRRRGPSRRILSQPDLPSINATTPVLDRGWMPGVSISATFWVGALASADEPQPNVWAAGICVRGVIDERLLDRIGQPQPAVAREFVEPRLPIHGEAFYVMTNGPALFGRPAEICCGLTSTPPWRSEKSSLLLASRVVNLSKVIECFYTRT